MVGVRHELSWHPLHACMLAWHRADRGQAGASQCAGYRHAPPSSTHSQIHRVWLHAAAWRATKFTRWWTLGPVRPLVFVCLTLGVFPSSQ